MTAPRVRGERWRSWLPLGSTLPILLLLLLFPSALNVPQTPPNQTLEFAPVPPEDDEPPPPESGNISTVGLGSTQSGPVAGDAPGEEPSVPPPPLPGIPDGRGERPITKRCVGSPPRQTEDPMSPPCVAHFDGDNGGATAPGVTAEEVVILVYVEAKAFSVALGCASEGCDVNTFYDLGKPPEASPHDERTAYWPHVWRVWQTYFGSRFQTYGRTPHLWVHFGSQETTPEARIADVAEAASRLDPFAVIADVDINGEVYADEWAARGRPVFLTKTSAISEVGFDASIFRQYPGRLWAYEPSVQELADNFTTFLCSQVVGHTVSYAGDGSNGQPRRLGLVVTEDPNRQNRIRYAELVRERLLACGADIASEVVYENIRPPAGDSASAEMRQAGVTTILYLTNTDVAVGFSQAVGRQVPEWRPEWVVQWDSSINIRTYEDDDVFQYARNFSTWPLAINGGDRPCEQAFLEVAPRDAVYAEAWPVCYTYNMARMLFTGIQVAGPRLTADSLDQGMHAIPGIPSGDVRVPACFYRPGDYTCVKDAQLQWWDPSGTTDRAAEPGCWRSMDGGKRYLPGEWPVRDVDAVRDVQADPCNIQGTY